MNPYSIPNSQSFQGSGGMNFDIPPGVNLPYGYPSFSPIDRARNEANRGFAPAASIATGNPMFDTMVNLMISSFNGGKPMLGSFKRPVVSDYQHTAMQERNRVFDLAKPSLLAANPALADLGEVGQNRLFQEFADQYTPGGSMTDAFGVVMGNFTENMAGPGIRNAEANAIQAANIVRNVSNGMSDKDGNWDYSKSSGFNRAETFQNMAAFNRKFGGYVGEVSDRSQQAKDNNLTKLAGEVLKRPSLPYGPTPQRVEEIQKAKQDFNKAQQVLSTPDAEYAKKIDVTAPTKLAMEVIERANKDGRIGEKEKEELARYPEALNAINTLNEQKTQNTTNTINEQKTQNTNNTKNTENVENIKNENNVTNKKDKVERIIEEIDKRTQAQPEKKETQQRPVEVSDTLELDTTMNQLETITKKYGTTEEIERFNKQKEVITNSSERSVDITEPSKTVKNVLKRASQGGQLNKEDIDKISKKSPQLIESLNKLGEEEEPTIKTDSKNKATSVLDQSSRIIEKFGTQEEKEQFNLELQKLNKENDVFISPRENNKEGTQKSTPGTTPDNKNKEIDITNTTRLTKNALDRARENNQISESDEQAISYYSDANEAIQELSQKQEIYETEKSQKSPVKVAPGEELNEVLSQGENVIEEFGTPEEKESFKRQKNNIIESTNLDITDTTRLTKQIIERQQKQGIPESKITGNSIEVQESISQLNETGEVKKREGKVLGKVLDDSANMIDEYGTEEEKQEFKTQLKKVNQKRGIKEPEEQNYIDITSPTETVKQVIERAEKEGKVSDSDKEQISSYKEAVQAIDQLREDNQVNRDKNDKDPKATATVKNSDELKNVLGQFSKIVEKFGNDNDVRELRSESDKIVEENQKKTENARNTLNDTIDKFGTEKDKQKAAEISNPVASSDLQSLSETRTPRNAKEQDKAIGNVSELNSMVREAQNLFGADMGMDELMDQVGKLVEGASGMSAGRVRDLLQKIQATAVVVDMSNEAIARYFEVTNEMYKGMGVKGGNHTNMAQNALIAAKGVTDARKKEAQEKGEMYTGESTEEMAVKIAEYQGRVARSSVNQDLAATLSTLGTEGEEGKVASEIKQAMDAGDFDRARQIKDQAIASGRISKDTAQTIDIRESEYEKNGGVSENDYKLIKSKHGEGAYFENLTGENFEFVREQVYGNITDSVMGSRNDSYFSRRLQDEVGVDGVNQMREALSSGKITQEDLQDNKKLTEKLSGILPGASKEQIQRVAGNLTAATNQGNIADQFNVAGSEKAMEEIAKKNKERTEIQKEIETIHKERGPLLRDLNLGEEAAGIMLKTYKDLKKDGNSEDQITFESIVRANGGELGDYDKMTEDEKRVGQAQLDYVTGKGGEIQEKYDQAKKESHEYAVEQVKKFEEKNVLTDERRKEMIEEYESKAFEEKKSKITEEFESGRVKIQGQEAEKEKKSDFDPKDAIERILRALEGIADKLGVETTKAKSKDSSGGAEIRTENNGTWWY